MIRQWRKNLKVIDSLVLLASTAILTVLSLGNMHWSIWFDEAYGAFMIHLSPVEMVGYTAVDVHPPFYYFMLKTWQVMFGSSEVALRSFSLVCLLLAMVIGYFLLRKLFGRMAAGVATVLVSFSPMIVRYTDEMRMYGLVVLIAIAATWLLVSVTEKSKKWKWVLYAVLVSLGMWTHYFSAVVWIAHWVWRGTFVYHKGMKKQEWIRKFLSPQWLASYALAVALYLPWIPTLLHQIRDVQGGFWIGRVGAYSFTNFATNLLFYREHHEVLSWLAVLYFLVIGLLVWLGVVVYRALSQKEKRNYLLLVCLSIVPPLALFMISLPPLQSSFVERYLLTSYLASTWLVAVTLVMAWRQKRYKWWALFGSILVVVSFYIGTAYVYQIGNYNKNTNSVIRTKELMDTIYSQQQKVPILSESPWLFYEAVFYETSDHPVYFVDPGNYPFGSMAMLRDDTMHRVNDVSKWTVARPDFWYIMIAKESDYHPPIEGLREVSRITLSNPGKDSKYIAVHYQRSY